MGKLIITESKLTYNIQANCKNTTRNRPYQYMTKYTKNTVNHGFDTKVIKRDPVSQILRWKRIMISALNQWTKHSVFCHVRYSITEPVISSQGQHVILFPTTKRQWQIHWPLSPELNTFITTKTTLHLLPSRPLWAPTITHTCRLHHGIISQSALSFRTQTMVWGLWVYGLWHPRQEG